MKKTVFTGAGVAIITPMFEDHSVNYQEFGRIIDHQIENGTDAIIVAGTTGEASTMGDQEHIDVIGFAVRHTAGRVPVIAGTGSNDTAYALWLSQEAQAVGADALLQVTPYYNKTSQRGLIHHFTKIADEVDLPMILYNVPSRTGMTIAPQTYAELAKHPNIVATKEASGNFSAIAHAMSLCGEDLDFYSGNDDQITPLMSLGGKGVISVLSNVAPKQTHEMCAKFLSGDHEGAAKMQISLIPLINALFSDVNPIPVKEAMNMLGWAAGPCRLPLYEMSSEGKTALKKALETANISK